MFEPVLQLTFQLVSEQLKGVKEAKMPAVQVRDPLGVATKPDLGLDIGSMWRNGSFSICAG